MNETTFFFFLSEGRWIKNRSTLRLRKRKVQHQHAGRHDAQQESTLADLFFFLDQFGSTSAVRIKLHEQQREIRHLERQVKRLMNKKDEIAGGGTENFAAEDDEKAVEDEEIKADLVSFLHTFGSARAVREKLEIQRHRIAGLQRTLRWLEDRQRGVEDNDESSAVGYLHTQSASTLAAPDDNILTVSQRGSPPELMEESPGRELERLQAGCRFPDGINTAPVIELNDTYDEARMCKVYGCDQRAVAWYLRWEHRANSKCSVAGCDKLVISIGGIHCCRHVLEQNSTGNERHTRVAVMTAALRRIPQT
ncbi:hypothetical protein PC110_g8723 [Phytophthora cactorum]|uniref:Uncharacterized protein n=1 Tax=Phytophthora cactorum TaxID=29920 RepID=A0A329SE64_9STRA|nr:hypothetical protein PC110_g8723 [Phytophthora cactorum]